MHLASVAARKAGGQAAELLEIVGLKEPRHHLPDELSGGEQQRVALALVLRPALLLGDEPTGNLDSKNGQDILGLFQKLQRQFETTVILVTHDARAALVCWRILSMQDGRLVHDGA